MNDNKVTASEVTAEMIEAWKQKFGEVFKITVDKGLDSEKVAYVRKPTRQELKYAMMSSRGGQDLISMQEVLVSHCMLGGDPVIQTDDEYFLAVAEKVSDLFKKREAELEKL